MNAFTIIMAALLVTASIPFTAALSIIPCDVTDTLAEGDTAAYTIRGVTYEVTALVVEGSASRARFIVNGVASSYITLNYSQIVGDLTVRVTSFSFPIEGGVSSAFICLNSNAVEVLAQPTVSITTPVSVYNGGSVTPSTSTTVTASASDPAGKGVSRVEFYFVERDKPNTLLGTDYSAPYTTTWDSSKKGDGDYSLLATVYTIDGRKIDTGEHRIRVYKPVEAKPTCSDYDGGINYYVSSSAYGKTRGTSYTNAIDNCGGASSNHVNEWYCDADNYLTQSTKECQYGCSNGACKEKPVTQTSCTDSDGGKNQFVKGTTAGYYNEYNPSLTGTDSCMSAPSAAGSNVYASNYLVESYCDNNVVKETFYTCANGCVDGACKQNTYTPPTTNTCIPDGGLDDTLHSTACCSGVAVEGSTLCSDQSDWYGDWSSCTQICGKTGVAAQKCPYGATGTEFCPCPAGTTNNGQYGIGVCTTVSAPSSLEMSIGSLSAPVTIVLYSDYESPYGAKWMRESWPEIKERYVDENKVRLVYKHFPLDFFAHSREAAKAASCANEQGAWYAYHVRLGQNQNDLSIAALKRYATSSGMDLARFSKCLESNKHEATVVRDIADGTAAGVSGTPTFLINGEMIVGAQPAQVFIDAIEKALGSTTTVTITPTTPTTPTAPTSPSTCAGCKDNNLCYDHGIRLKKGDNTMFCDIDGVLKNQKTLYDSCQNNFECASNQCSNGVCVDIQAELAAQRGLLEKILKWFGFN